MSTLLSLFLQNPIVLAIGAGIIAVAGAWFKGRLSGAKAERHKHAVEELAARDVSDQVDNDIGSLPAGKARDELKAWKR